MTVTINSVTQHYLVISVDLPQKIKVTLSESSSKKLEFIFSLLVQYLKVT